LSDAADLLIDAWVGKHQPAQVPFNILRYQRDKIIREEMLARKVAVDSCIQRLQDESLPIPYHLQREQYTSNLLSLQQQVRGRVIIALPAEICTSNRYRNRKQIDIDMKIRMKKQKSQKNLRDREDRKHRNDFTRRLLSHCRDFYDYHLKRRNLSKKMANNVEKQVEAYAKKREEAQKRVERDRLQALRENNEEAYIKLLKQAKNDRLLQLLEQTDTYMSHLGAHIQSVQQMAAEDEASDELHDNLDIPADDHADGTMNGTDRSDKAGTSKKKNEYIKIKSTAPAAMFTEQGINVEDMMNNTPALNKQASGVKAEATAAAATTDDDQGIEYLVNSRKRYYSMAHAIKEEIVEQPRCMRFGNLRKYQVEGLRWLVSLYNNHLNGILADEMGLGKTVQSLSLLAYLMENKHNYGPFLIIAPMSTLHNNWSYEINRWLPDMKVIIYDGDKQKRKTMRDTQITSGDFNVLLTTFEFSMRDTMLRKIAWEYIIIDEAHRLKNPKCKLATELNKYSSKARRVALTGTPLQNDLPELWALLNFLHPSIFNSSESFDRWFSSPFSAVTTSTKSNISDAVREAEEQNTNMTEEEQLLVINRLHSILRPFMLRREKREVETDMPDKVEKIVRCTLSESQRLLYENVMEGNVSIHNKMMQLRKVCNHPYLFHPSYRSQAGSTVFDMDSDVLKLSGKFALLDQVLPKLFVTKHRVLIFNQMTKSMDILDSYLTWRGYKFLRLDGMTDAETRQDGLRKFNAPDSEYFIFILSTKAGGLGLNLQTADTVILFDSDWNPQNDLQAMG
jgi:SWI/SNF-related matrix-associated actin-dependent regulator of chromatin subfamily A protein 2/4